MVRQRRVSRVVWHWRIPITDNMEMLMPDGTRVIHFGLRNGELTIWTLLDPSKSQRLRRFRLAGTGHPISEIDLRYIGTCFQESLVWHLFEVV